MTDFTIKEGIGNLLEWLNESNDFYLNPNVEVFESDVSGRGIKLATGMLNKNDTIVSIPSSHQINFLTVLYSISKFNNNIVVPNVTIDLTSKEIKSNQDSDDPRFKAYQIFSTDQLLKMSSFQLLCIFMMAEWILLPRWSNNKTKSWWQPFFNIFPTREELGSIPTIWNLSNEVRDSALLLELLSTSSKKHMERICDLVRTDWSIVEPILSQWSQDFPNTMPNQKQLFEIFLHIYFIINSRCLYAEMPLKSEPQDFLTLVPFVDYMNHINEVDEHCFPQLNPFKKSKYGLSQFSVKTGNHLYKVKDEEIFLNYGAHSNDFLINEYGFTTSRNPWNYIDLTPEISRLFDNTKDIEFLTELGYWGEFTVSSSGISYRILVAMALYCSNDYRRTEKFALGYISEQYFESKTTPILLRTFINLQQLYQMKIQQTETFEGSKWCKYNLVNIYNGYLDILETNIKLLASN